MKEIKLVPVQVVEDLSMSATKLGSTWHRLAILKCTG